MWKLFKFVCKKVMCMCRIKAAVDVLILRYHCGFWDTANDTQFLFAHRRSCNTLLAMEIDTSPSSFVELETPQNHRRTNHLSWKMSWLIEISWRNTNVFPGIKEEETWWMLRKQMISHIQGLSYCSASIHSAIFIDTTKRSRYHRNFVNSFPASYEIALIIQGI